MMRLALCMAVIFVALGAKAELKKSEILGVWTQTQNEQGVSVSSTYDFKADDTVTQILVVSSANPKVSVIADGTVKYQIGDDTITFKFSASDFNFSVFEIEGLPQEYVEVAKQQMLSQMTNMEQKLTDVKIEGNTLTAKFNGETISMQRN